MRSKKKNNIDFSLFPEINSQSIIIQLDKAIQTKIEKDSKLSESYERAEASVSFFGRATKESTPKGIAMFIRAGLNEFYSIEDAIKRDWGKSNIQGTPPKIHQSNHPLVHLAYLLRHASVHTHTAKIITQKNSFILADHEFDQDISVLSHPTIEEMKYSTNSIKYYEESDLVKIAEWVDIKQYDFGITEILIKGLSAYCREVFEAINK